MNLYNSIKEGAFEETPKSIESLKELLQNLADEDFYHEMKSHWTQEDFDRANARLKKINKVIEDLKAQGVEAKYHVGYPIEYKELKETEIPSELTVYDTENHNTIKLNATLDEYKECKTGKYIDGLEVGNLFGLRMLNTHNVNVYGRIKEISEDTISVEHPRGTIYNVSTKDISISTGKELRFEPANKEVTSWFGFIPITLNFQESQFDTDTE